MKYILNSAVVTTPGKYEYTIINVVDMVNWLEAGKFESCLGYEETAKAISALSGISVPVNRKNVRMASGDEALVFRLTGRVDNWRDKGELGLQFILDNCEIGLLRKE